MIDVVFAIPELDHGGPDRVVFEILTNMDRARFRPMLLVGSPTGHLLSRMPRDIPVHALTASRSLRGRYPVLDVVRFLHETRPDVVLATQRMILTLGIATPFLPRRTRLVIRQANDLTADFDQLVRRSLVKHRLARRMSLSALRRADAVVCQSEAMRRDLQSSLGDVDHLHVIGNPVDVERVMATATQRQVTLPGAPALVSIGRLAPQKGHDILLDAVARVRARFPQMHLTIFGDGPDRQALEAQARRLGLENHVTLRGFEPDPLPYVLRADLFVLASRYEGFPNAALEALACGTPIVLTDCPGANSDLVRDGVNGRLAADLSPEAVARALESALAELPSFDRAVVQSTCRDRFATPKIVSQYQHVLERVLS
jgi:glycosyltransferase involved in cell wall biosynthesis